MPILGIDLGATKLAVALFTEAGKLVSREIVPLANRKSSAVAELINSLLDKYLSQTEIESIGVSVPGISRRATGTVWAPNIEGWDDYPLLREIKTVVNEIPVAIDSDRACSILGEQWQGNAKDSKDAIFLAVGTGIGAGIITDGHLLRGHNDIAGAIGWMALSKPFDAKYISCGCFEYYASGAGIAKFAREVLSSDPNGSILRVHPLEEIKAHHVFDAYEKQDPIASIIMHECIACWGMAAANLVSLFNPEKIIFGGGIFGPAVKFIDKIKVEATKWAQPVSICQVNFEASKLGSDAAVYGAAFLAMKNSNIHSR
jgi:glucokinase